MEQQTTNRKWVRCINGKGIRGIIISMYRDVVIRTAFVGSRRDVNTGFVFHPFLLLLLSLLFSFGVFFSLSVASYRRVHLSPLTSLQDHLLPFRLFFLTPHPLSVLVTDADSLFATCTHTLDHVAARRSRCVFFFFLLFSFSHLPFYYSQVLPPPQWPNPSSFVVC